MAVLLILSLSLSLSLPRPLRGRQRLSVRRLGMGWLGLLLRISVRPRRLVARLRRGVGLRPPGPAPRLPARGHGLALVGLALVDLAAGGRPRDPGGTAVGGQHDTFVRGSSSGELLLAALSALRHRDSYV